MEEHPWNTRTWSLLMMRLSLVLVAGLLVGCGAGIADVSAPDDSVRQRVARPAAASSADAAWPVSIPWDLPLGPGAPRVTLETARTVGQLPFEAPRPPWGSPLVVQVTDPSTRPAASRALAMTYDLSDRVGPGRDGRVLVQARPTEQTVAHLQHMAATNEPADSFTMIDVDGRPALLITGSGLGRVVLIVDGVQYSVTGPDVSPELAQVLAGEAFVA